MKIRDIRLQRDGARAEASAVVEWEEAARPPATLTFAVEGPMREALEPAPEAFVLAAALAAARVGERRLRIDGDLCPVLVDGLRSSFALLDTWYGGDRSSMAIEAARGFRARPRGAAAAALFLSGGVDSLHALRRNRLDLPREHPASFRMAIHVRSFGFAGETNAAAARNVAERAAPCISRVAEAEGLGLAVVESNALLLEPDHRFFVLESHGSLLASAAHLFGRAIRSASIAASADLRRTFRPWGSHPLLDPLYGSSAVATRHTGHEHSRLEKVAELSRWDLALSSLIVCNEAPLPPGVVNCGTCEKCLRTLCEIYAAGAVERASTFAVRNVTPEAIRRLPTVEEHAIRRWEDLRREFGSARDVFDRGSWPWLWQDLRVELENADELVRAIEDWIARLHRVADWKNERGFKGRLRRLDRRWLGGSLLGLRRRWSAGR